MTINPYSILFFAEILKFSSLLIHWYKENKRDLPWRDTSDPYAIWLSETILQQTRVAQGLPYFQKFITHYPTVHYLAEADEREILSLWQGLGYYSRARNLHAAAKQITEKFNGVFPTTYEDILKLKGVGPYTAAAIASFAYNLPHPVIDGNVQRVISRIFNIDTPIDTKSGLNEIKEALDSVFEPRQAAEFNQAIMEIGALICTPKAPTCVECPLQSNCLAYSKKNVHQLPIKKGKTKVSEVDFTYLFIRYRSMTYIEKRNNGIWKNLYQFPLIELQVQSKNIATKLSEIINLDGQSIQIEHSFSKTHLLSHRRINAHFYTIQCSQPPVFLKSNIFEIELELLGRKYPIPVLIAEFLKYYKSDD